jgi:hypothetical protein
MIATTGAVRYEPLAVAALIVCRTRVGVLMMLEKSPSWKAPEAARARTGRPSSYKPEYVKMAKHVAKLGATDADLLSSSE